MIFHFACRQSWPGIRSLVVAATCVSVFSLVLMGRPGRADNRYSNTPGIHAMPSQPALTDTASIQGIHSHACMASSDSLVVRGIATHQPACCLSQLIAQGFKALPLTGRCLSQLGPALIAQWSKVLPQTARCLSKLGPALIAQWSNTLPLTARCLSPLHQFESCSWHVNQGVARGFSLVFL